MRSIPYRRSQRERIRKSFREVVKHCWGYDSHRSWFGETDANEWLEHTARKLADTRKPCSCRGCGNQRQHEGAPIRERRQEWIE